MNKQIKAKFNNKLYPIPIEMRPLWRICLIIISIFLVSNNDGMLSLNKLNVFVWMLIRKNKWNAYKNFLINFSDEIPLVSIDTATYKAIEFARAKNYICIENDKISLSSIGKDVYKLIVEIGIMIEEIQFLNDIGAKLTENKVKILAGR